MPAISAAGGKRAGPRSVLPALQAHRLGDHCKMRDWHHGGARCGRRRKMEQGDPDGLQARRSLATGRNWGRQNATAAKRNGTQWPIKRQPWCRPATMDFGNRLAVRLRPNGPDRNRTILEPETNPPLTKG